MNTKKYFIASDVHSCYTALKEALKVSGYDINNENHILILNGDLFDRSNETLELYNFIKSIPKERKILIQGNHELLFKELLEAELPGHHDAHNGTLDTFCQIAGVPVGSFDTIARGGWPTIAEKDAWKKVQTKVKKSEIAEWICNKENWVDYYEFDKFIITHAFIPTKLDPTLNQLDIKVYLSYPPYRIPARYYFPMLNWRIEATELDWYDAKWLDAADLYAHKKFKAEVDNGKVLIVGHKWCEQFYGPVSYKKAPLTSKPFCSDHLIAIDGRVFDTGVMNVLVINEKFEVWDKNQTQLM